MTCPFRAPASAFGSPVSAAMNWDDEDDKRDWFDRRNKDRPARYMPASKIYTSCPQRMRKLSLGCPHLDRLLGGGIDHHGITEIA
eukprot:7043441-Prymnesium_polylepis.1